MLISIHLYISIMVILVLISNLDVFWKTSVETYYFTKAKVTPVALFIISNIIYMEKVAFTHLLPNFKYQALPEISTDVFHHAIRDSFLYSPFSCTQSFICPCSQEIHSNLFGIAYHSVWYKRNPPLILYISVYAYICW